MVTSIVLTDCYSIGINGSKKFKVNDNVLSVEKDIPFVRYRFNQYTDREFEYIKNMIQKFSNSTHLAEIKLDERTVEIVKYIEENISNMAKFIYIDITDDAVLNGTVGDEIKDLLEPVVEFDIDRVMLRDKSTKLDTVAAKRIITDLGTEFDLDDEMIGICSSPLCFGEWACLTAVKARELMSKYNNLSDVALPSANHQSMNTCGCIRYMIISENLEAPSDGKIKKEKTAKTPSEKKEKAPAKPKGPAINNLPFL